MLGQIIKIIKLLGLSRAARMKKHHERGLGYVRGYAACCCWWTLLNNGFLDRLAERDSLNLDVYSRENPCQGDVLEAIVEYLDGIGLLVQSGREVRLGQEGRILLAEPRGLFELLWAYEPCFHGLPDLLTGSKRYGRDVHRRITYVGLGSGRLCEQLPYPVMRRMVLDRRCRTVLDLGCGDLAFLKGLCRLDSSIRCHGIDFSEEMVRFDRERLAQEDYAGRLTVQQGDMFDLPALPEHLPAVDCITACDTFHEYLGEEDRLVGLFKDLRERFRGTYFVIGEFCLQDAEWLRRHRTASLEHHLFHQLSGQLIGTAEQWRRLFDRAGLDIIEEQIYDLIGHGYFLLR